MAIIEVSGLRKTYGGRPVVDGVSFSVEEGEIFGILGPNGAGKTTTVECVEGLRVPDAGTVRVAGLDPVADHEQVTRILGAQLQESELQEKLTVREALELYSAFYPNPPTGGPSSSGSTSPTGSPSASASSPAARSSGCSSRWRSSATPGSSCSTSSPRAWTRGPAATPGS
jgi:ABC transporter